MLSTETLCQMFFQLFKNVLSWKNWFFEQKTAQPVEPNEEPIDLQLNWLRSGLTPSSTGRGWKKTLSFRTVVQPVKVEPQAVDPHLNW